MKYQVPDSIAKGIWRRLRPDVMNVHTMEPLQEDEVWLVNSDEYYLDSFMPLVYHKEKEVIGSFHRALREWLPSD